MSPNETILFPRSPWWRAAAFLAVVGLCAFAYTHQPPGPTTTGPRPAAAAAAVPADPTPDEARAEAVRLLGAAGSARTAGDLGIAWELGRQAAAKWPAYAEAQQFVTDVEAQRKTADDAAAYAAAHNGWSPGGESFLFSFYFSQPDVSLLAATCAAVDTGAAMTPDDYTRRQQAGDPALGRQLYAILQQCRVDTRGLPLG
jgi:hypothetical protein